jgi:hypothetical protein
MARDVEDEFVEFFSTRQLPFLIAARIKDSTIFSATLQGHLEPALKATLSALLQRGASSAPQLHEAFPAERVTVTAWNNRLADLHAVRLVSRTRNGKVWEYKPVIERIVYGRRFFNR